MKGYIYLASPYSDPDTSLMELRYRSALEYTAKCIARGEWVYSPIVHNHAIALHYEQSNQITDHRTFSFWREYDMTMLAHAAVFRVLMLNRWDSSKGINEEMVRAKSLGLEVQMIQVENDPTYSPVIQDQERAYQAIQDIPRHGSCGEDDLTTGCSTPPRS